jgi:hypothetical protein
MNGGLVWLLLIPLFNIIWHFIIVGNISTSLHNEFTSRNIQQEPSPGKSVGIAMCVLYVCSIIPAFGLLCALAGFICWICYWVKVAGFSALLVKRVAPQQALPEG